MIIKNLKHRKITFKSSIKLIHINSTTLYLNIVQVHEIVEVKYIARWPLIGSQYLVQVLELLVISQLLMDTILF